VPAEAMARIFGTVNLAPFRHVEHKQPRSPSNMLPFWSRAILIAALVIGSAEARADMPALGLGNQRCGTWTANNPANGGIGLLYEQCIFGFLSGVHYADPDHDPLKGMNGREVTKWIDEFCQNDSAALLQDAAIEFVRTHRP
jgi:hypothetical protein